MDNERFRQKRMRSLSREVDRLKEEIQRLRSLIDARNKEMGDQRRKIAQLQATIDRLGEPDEAMIEAGRKANSEHGSRNIYRGLPFAEIYKAMLSAAKEGEYG